MIRVLAMNMSTLKPTKIERLETRGLLIEWSEAGRSVVLPVELLRSNCPCALCREKRGEGNHDTPLTPKKSVSRLQVISHTRDEELNLQRIWPIGNYAIGIQWGDGHDDGIYTFGLLRELTEKVDDNSATGELETKRA